MNFKKSKLYCHEMGAMGKRGNRKFRDGYLDDYLR